MSEVDKDTSQNPAVVEDEDLDNWFDEDDDEGRSAEDDEEEEEESSASESDEESSSDEEEVPEPDAKDKQEPKASDKGSSSKPAKTEKDPYEWVSSLDPELRSKVEALVHSDRSNRGRVAALRSRLDEIQAEKEAQFRVSPKEAADAAAAKGLNIEDMSDEDLEAFLEEVPTIASGVKRLAKQIAAEEVAKVRKEYQPYIQQAETARRVEAREELRANAREIFNTAETGIELEDVTGSVRFREWLEAQPPGYQEFAKRANSVGDATKVLIDFAQFADEQVYREWERDHGSSADKASEDKPSSSSRTADETAARRKAALKGSSPRSKSAEVHKNSGNELSYEAYFDEAVEAGH